MIDIDLLSVRYLTTLLTLSLLLAITLFLILKSKNVLLMFLVPLIVILGTDTYTSVNTLLGTSRADPMPKEQVRVLAIHPGVDKKWIHIWYYDQSIGQPRAIKIPYSEENKKQGDSADEQIKNGQNSFMSFYEGKDGKSIVSYSFSTKALSKKNQKPPLYPGTRR